MREKIVREDSMDPYEFAWVRTSSRGSARVRVGPHEFVWVYMD